LSIEGVLYGKDDPKDQLAAENLRDKGKAIVVAQKKGEGSE
jgi:hypothetical protein